MPAKDKYHDAVINALKKDGWQIVREQARLSIGKRHLWVDLKIERNNQVEYVEIKGFETDYSKVSYLHATVGQYITYRATLESLRIPFQINLALPESAYTGILSEKLGQAVLKHVSLRILLINVNRQEVTEWITW